MLTHLLTLMLSLPTLPANLQANLRALHERITKAARGAGRDPSSVRLLAVSKAFPATVIAEAARAGQRAFGENYVQEAVDKIDALAGSAHQPLEWHFIGPIQSNKTRTIAERFDWVQSVDRLKVAERLARSASGRLAAAKRTAAGQRQWRSDQSRHRTRRTQSARRRRCTPAAAALARLDGDSGARNRCRTPADGFRHERTRCFGSFANRDWMSMCCR